MAKDKPDATCACVVASSVIFWEGCVPENWETCEVMLASA